MIDSELIQKAGQTLLEAAPGSQVILFGSYARGDAKPGSDLDFLVVLPKVKARRAEMVRLGETLHCLGIYADILVISEENFNEWATVPGTVVYEAAQQGKVFRASE